MAHPAAHLAQMNGRTNDAFAEAELHRARGDLLNTNGDVAGADLTCQNRPSR
jgi:hypothetical protein